MTISEIASIIYQRNPNKFASQEEVKKLLTSYVKALGVQIKHHKPIALARVAKFVVSAKQKNRNKTKAYKAKMKIFKNRYKIAKKANSWAHEFIDDCYID